MAQSFFDLFLQMILFLSCFVSLVHPPSCSMSTGTSNPVGSSFPSWSCLRGWSCTTALCSAPLTDPTLLRCYSNPTSSPPPSIPWRLPSQRRESPADTFWVSYAFRNRTMAIVMVHFIFFFFCYSISFSLIIMVIILELYFCDINHHIHSHRC